MDWEFIRSAHAIGFNCVTMYKRIEITSFLHDVYEFLSFHDGPTNHHDSSEIGT